MKLLERAGNRSLRSRFMAGLPLAMAAIALITLSLAIAPAASAEGKGALKGSVTNLTKDGGSVANLDITLLGYQGQTQKVTKNAKSGSDGTVSFTGLDTGADWAYLMSIEYQGVPYYSQPVNLTDDKAEQESVIPVFESTSSADSIKTSAHHYLVEPDSTGVDITEIIIVSNASDRTYVGSKEAQPGMKETLRIALPAGAQDVKSGGDTAENRVFPVDGALVDTWPIYPGDSQRMYSYRMPVKDNAVTFKTQVTMASDAVNVLMPDTGVEIAVSNLGNRTSADMQGTKFVVITGQDLAAGTELEFKLNKTSAGENLAAAQTQPATGAQPGQTGQTGQAGQGSQQAQPSSFEARNPVAATILRIVWVIPVIVAIGGGVYFYMRHRKAQARKRAKIAELEAEPVEQSAPSRNVPLDDSDDLEADRQILVGAIAQLDDRFEQGEIGAEEYGRLRGEKKRKLVDVVARQRALVKADQPDETEEAKREEPGEEPR